MPKAFPNTTPVASPTGAMAGLLLLHVPGVEESLKVRVPPRQILVLPVIGAGSGLTVTVVVIAQVVGSVYIITVVPPPIATPVTIPDDGSTVAIADDPELHIPPAVASDKIVVNPLHTEVIPVIGAGNGFTVTR